jgi:hypothetical protein
MIAATAIAIGMTLGTWHKDSSQVESVPNAYAVVSVLGQSLAVGTMRKDNVWLGWRGETGSLSVLGVPVRAAVTIGATAERVTTYTPIVRDWAYYRMTMLSGSRENNRPLGRGPAFSVGRKTVVDPLVLLSVGAEVSPGWTVWLSKSDLFQVSVERSFK